MQGLLHPLLCGISARATVGVSTLDPGALREAGPDATAYLFYLTNNDQANISASLVGRSLKFARVVTRSEDPELGYVCIELGLEDAVIPACTTGRFLTGLVEGRDPLELSTMIRYEARVFSFILPDEDAGPLEDLELPQQSRVICFYRARAFVLPERDTRLTADDEIVVLTHRQHIRELERRWT